MKLICLNVERNKHDKLVLSFLKKENADIVCLQEFLEEKFELYKKELGLEGFLQITNYADVIAYDELAGKRDGLAIFARNIIEPGVMFYIGSEENIPKSFEKYKEELSSPDYQTNHALIWASVKDKDGKSFKIVNTHLPVTDNGEVTPFQLDVVDKIISELDKHGEFIFCGDLNAPRGRESFARFAKKYKDNIPPEYNTSLDENLHRIKGIIFMVDGLFTTPAYRVSEVKLVGGVSDHMAIVAEITNSPESA